MPRWPKKPPLEIPRDVPLPENLTTDLLGRFVRYIPPGPVEPKRYRRLPDVWAGKAVRRGKPNPADGFQHVSDHRRRVVVVMDIKKLRVPDAMKDLHAYVHYLQRPGAGEREVAAGLFNATEDDVRGHAAVKRWADDRHYFVPVVAPNDGHLIGRKELLEAGNDIPGTLTGERVAEIRAEAFRSFVRDVVAGWEKALDTKLEWFAAVHEKPDRAHAVNRHAHVVIRGVADDHTDLVMDRAFIREPIIRIAEDAATARLGMMRASELRELRERQGRGRRRAPTHRLGDGIGLPGPTDREPVLVVGGTRAGKGTVPGLPDEPCLGSRPTGRRPA